MVVSVHCPMEESPKNRLTRSTSTRTTPAPAPEARAAGDARRQASLGMRRMGNVFGPVVPSHAREDRDMKGRSPAGPTSERIA